MISNVGSRLVAMLVFGLVTNGIHAQDQRSDIEDAMIEVDGLAVHVRRAGFENATPDRPTVVFVSGLASLAQDWDFVLPEVATIAPTIAYDRPGLGSSEANGLPPTPRNVSTHLRALLDAAAVAPPYVMVGHSLGGMYIRSFAAMHPNDIAGLVYVDSTPFTKTTEGELLMWEMLGPGEEGMEKFRAGMHPGGMNAPPPIAAEFKEASRLWATDYADVHELGDPPDVPTVVLAADARNMPLDQLTAQLDVEWDAFARAFQNWRMAEYESWAMNATRGTLLTSTQSGHYIQLDEPDLVVWAVRRVLAPPAVNARLLLKTILDEGVEKGIALYRAAKSDAPPGRINVMLLNEVAFMLFQDQKLDESIRILDFNLQEYPEEWIAYGSLAQAYMAKGDTEKAIVNLRRVLELNPNEQRAKALLERLERD